MSHRTPVLLAIASCGNLFYAAVVVALPTHIFFSFFYKTAEFSHIKESLQGNFSVNIVFMQSNTA